MNLSSATAAVVATALAIGAASSSSVLVLVHATDETIETPYLHLKSGALVYHTPASGGVIKVKPNSERLPVDDEDEDAIPGAAEESSSEGAGAWTPADPLFGEPLLFQEPQDADPIISVCLQSR